MAALRVGQIIETMNMGGAENLAVQQANYLVAEGHDSHLIVLTGPGPLSGRISPRVKVHYLAFERKSVSNPIGFLTSVLNGHRSLARAIRESGIQVVQSHLPGSNFLALTLELRKVCPVLATIHNNEEFRYGDVDSRFRVWARKFAYKQLLLRGHGIIAVSEDVKGSFARQLNCTVAQAERISVVTNAVPFPEPLDEVSGSEVRARFGISTGEPFLLAAGRLSEQKNFRDLVAAAAILRDAGAEFRLVIGGEGALRPELEQQVGALQLEDRVDLPGNIQDLGRVMQAADIFVMSSLWEGLPLVLLEAMAAGRPIVAYGIQGIDEVITEGQEGRKPTVGDPQALADALQELLADAQKRQAMGETAHKTVARRYSFATLIEQLVKLYRRALGETR